jgi:hypothetical protein
MTTVAKISVAIWYTDDFAKRETDIQGYINTCFQEANAGMTNSKIPITLIHHGTKRYTGAEILDGGQMIAAFALGGSE